MTQITKTALNKQLVAKMQRDLEFYGKVCLSIRTKDAEIKRFEFNNAQRIVHRKLRDQYRKEGRIRAIVLKARQEGVSTYTAARFFRRVHLMPNQEALVLADELDRAKKLFSIYDRFNAYLPPEIKPMTRYVSKQTQLVLDNPDDKIRSSAPGLGSSISVETAKDTAAGRAQTPNLVHVSEMAFWDNATDVWVSLQQGVPDRSSEVIVESTANGVGNFFHQMWQASEEGENSFIPIFLPWWIHEEYKLKLTKKEKEFVKESLDDLEGDYHENGILLEGKPHHITLEQIAWRRQTIRDKLQGDVRAFQQEYPANPEEAFLVSGNCFFDEDILKKYERSTKPPIQRINLIRKVGAIKPERAKYGYCRVWRWPGKKEGDLEPHYIIAADTATGRQVSARDASFTDPDSERGGRDFSSADVLDVRNRRQVAQLHGRMAPEVFAQQLDLLGKFYSNALGAGTTRSPALIAVEKNHSSGETVLRQLQQVHRYPRLFYGKQINRRTNRTQQVLGFTTSVETRMPMLDALAAAIREENIEIPNKDTIKEMFTFVRGEDGKPQAQDGTHDDRVISLAIALFVSQITHVELPKHYNEVDQYRPTGTDGEMYSPTGLFRY